jgi:hypothetical protein
MRAPSTADLVKSKVAAAKALGKEQGWGLVVSDQLIGDTIVLRFESGNEVHLPLPKSARFEP